MMLNDAFTFMRETISPKAHHEARLKIALLAKEIQDTYKAHMQRSTGKTCDICGAGDTDEQRRVHDLVRGYEHREHLSPVLCYNHYCGWRMSYSRLETNRKQAILGIPRPRTAEEKFSSIIQIDNTVFDENVLSDEEIDLHFTQFLANQLIKAARRSA
jgi:hypothetical protein